MRFYGIDEDIHAAKVSAGLSDKESSDAGVFYHRGAAGFIRMIERSVGGLHDSEIYGHPEWLIMIHAIHFNGGHACELLLKSMLASKGATLRELRLDEKHGIARLMERAKTVGLQLTDQTWRTLETLVTDLHASPEDREYLPWYIGHRYPTPGAHLMCPPQQLIAALQQLHEETGRAILAAIANRVRYSG